MTKLLTGIFEHGQIKINTPLHFAEHQKVLIAVIVDNSDPSGLLIAQAAQESKSFNFLNDSKEDIYSIADGEDV